MSGDVHVRFCEGVGVRLPRATHRTLCCRSKEDAEAALALTKKLLIRLDLEINPRKTAIYHAEKGLHYLGERLLFKRQGEREEVVVVPREPAPPARTLQLPARSLEHIPEAGTP